MLEKYSPWMSQACALFHSLLGPAKQSTSSLETLLACGHDCDGNVAATHFRDAALRRSGNFQCPGILHFI